MKIEHYVDVGHTLEGKRIRKHIRANSQAEFARLVEEAKAYYKKVKPSEITFEDYAKHWKEVYKSSKEAATINMYETALNKTELVDKMRMADITSTDLQEIIADNYEHPFACGQLALTLNQIFKRAVKDKIISDNPADDLELPPMVSEEGRSLTSKELKAIKKIELDPMDRIYIEILYYLGVRPGEAVALMIQDFDFKTNRVTIRRAVGYDRNNPYIKDTKARNVRKLPIPDEFVPKVKSYIQNLKSQNSLYLVHRDGKPITRTVRGDMWQRIKKKINIELGGNNLLDVTNGLRPYTFRHNFCTNCLYSGISLRQCQYLMGHKDTKMIMKVYSHIEAEREPMDALKKMAM